MAKLTVLELKKLTAPGRYTDGDGLHLHVRSAERRAWVFRYTKRGKTRDLGLGPYPDVSLAEARKAATDARAKLRAGVDPVAARQAIEAQASGHTFKEAAEEYIASHKDGWRNPKHAAQWAATLAAHAYPAIGATAVQDLTVNAILDVLKPIWTKTPETATRLRGRIEAILDAATARGWRTGDNPARWKGNLKGLLPPRGRVQQVQHQPALPWQQISGFMAELRTQSGISAKALEFVILTAARTGEVRGARWSEIDLDEALWVVPAERMKGKRLHRAPLSSAAVALLREMLPLKAGSGSLVFPAAKEGRRRKADPAALGTALVKEGRPLSDMTLSMLIRRMNGDTDPPSWRDINGRAIVPHGFRSTFRVWAGEETAYPREVVEAALAHALRDKVEAAYARTDLLERRRPLMEEWGKVCSVAAMGAASSSAT